MIIMGSLFIVKGQIPPLTPEQKKRLAALENIRDEDIDYSDIPPLTDEELARMKPARLRRRLKKSPDNLSGRFFSVIIGLR